MPVTVEVLGLNEVLERLQIMQWSLPQVPRVIVQKVSAIAKEAMQNEAPVRTGALKRGIRYRTFEGSLEAYARFYVDDPASEYAMFVIEGTAAHDIFPRDRKALFWPGADHPVAFVHHPGTKPNDFVGRAMDEVQKAAEALLDATGEAIVNGERL
jgi:hypothetical protein